MKTRRTGRALLAAAATAGALAVLGPASASAGYTSQIDGAILRLNGDDAADQIFVARGAGDEIVFVVNNGAAQPTGATINTVSQIVVDARGGDDQASIQ